MPVYGHAGQIQLFLVHNMGIYQYFEIKPFWYQHISEYSGEGSWVDEASLLSTRMPLMDSRYYLERFASSSEI